MHIQYTYITGTAKAIRRSADNRGHECRKTGRSGDHGEQNDQFIDHHRGRPAQVHREEGCSEANEAAVSVLVLMRVYYLYIVQYMCAYHQDFRAHCADSINKICIVLCL